jgi:molybdate transport system ATP-binding protein
MDEPLAALDAGRKAEILPVLERLNTASGIPIVYVTHAVSEVARLADHVVLMEHGSVVAAGPVSELLARLDVRLPVGEDAGVVLQGAIGERDPQWSLARLDVAGASFWTSDEGSPIGRRVRLRVLARDVSLSRERQTGISTLNQIPVVVDQLADDMNPSQVTVRVRLRDGPDSALLARITRRSAQVMSIAPGQALWALVKAVSLLE